MRRGTEFSRPRMIAASSALILTLAAGLSAPTPMQAQEIAFSSELPRTLVFISEEGAADVATREFSSFLRAAGFPLVDPALAQTAAQRDLVQAALEGDEQAAVELGRDFGAQMIVLGTSEWATNPDPLTGRMVTGTSEVAVRALRLDNGDFVADAVVSGRRADATDQGAKTAAITEATTRLAQETSMVGQMINNWESSPWQEQAYWAPDPGSVPASVNQSTGEAPGVAILLADVRPSTAGTTRGLGVVKKGDRSESLFNPVRLEGVVVGSTRGVTVEGKPANLVPLEADEAAQLGLTGQQAQKFWSETTLPMSRDSVVVVAEGPGGATSRTVAAPRIDERWAVVIGISEYQSEDIPDLDYAKIDAEAVRDFLTSSAAGPFEDDHVLFLSDEEATGAAMREALFVFLQQADWDDLVVIYYAGHGAPDPSRPDNLYLLPHDADVNSLAATGFPMWDVKTALRRQISAERVIVIADACHSAGTADGDVVTDGDNQVAGSFQQLFTPSRRLMMTAADTNEFSLEDERWGGHGVFTHFLLEGLKGDGDGNDDGIVTFSELFAFVSNSVTTATEGRQNPQRAGFGDVPLAVVEEPATATGEGPPIPDGAGPRR